MSASNHFCNVCAVWVYGNVGNVKRHEASDFHKTNVQSKVKVANEKSKSDKAEAMRVNKEIDAINRAASASMSSDPSINGNSQIPPGWISLRDPQTGRGYLFNKSSGETRWIHATEPTKKQDSFSEDSIKPPTTKPHVLSTVSDIKAVPSSVTTEPPPRPISSNPPPRPVNTAPTPRPVSSGTTAPPPRPKTTSHVPPPRPPAVPESVSILNHVMMSSKEAARYDPSNMTNGSLTSTGFGEWEEVSPRAPQETTLPEPDQTTHEAVVFSKQEKLSFSFGNVKREAPDDDGDEPLFATRQIKKSSRTRPRADD